MRSSFIRSPYYPDVSGVHSSLRIGPPRPQECALQKVPDMHVSTWPALHPLMFVQRESSCRTPFPFYATHKVFGYLARSLIYHLFKALEIKPGEAVLVPDYHHGNEVQAIKAAGAELRFYRVDKELRPDLEDLEKK
jgi:hypothetical protein